MHNILISIFLTIAIVVHPLVLWANPDLGESTKVYMYPKIVEQEVKLNPLQRSSFVLLDLGVASAWASVAGVASGWDPFIVTTVFFADALIGLFSIPIYSTGLLKALAIYKKKSELQKLADLEASENLHIFTGGPAEYTHLFGYPLLAKWMKTRSLVFVSSKDPIENSPAEENLDLIEISDLQKSHLELKLLIHNEDLGLTRVEAPLYEVLSDYKIPVSIQKEWARAIKSSKVDHHSDTNFIIEASLFLDDGTKEELGIIADDPLVKKMMVLTEEMKLKRWFYVMSKKFFKFAGTGKLAKALSHEPRIHAVKKKIHKNLKPIQKLIHTCNSYLGASFIKTH